MTLASEAYLWFKALHIIGVVVWFAGLFYLVRLFIYHVEIKETDPTIKKLFQNHNIFSLTDLNITDAIEDGGSFLENALIKAKHGAKESKKMGLHKISNG